MSGSTHDHGAHGHDHARNANARSILIALILTAGFLAAEVVGGFVFKSLALLSDAGHMFTDTAALAIALAAIRIGAKAPDDRRTFGYRRFEILAAAFNALLLFAVALYILWEGVQRIISPQPVQSMGMLAVAVVGLIINLIAMRVLAGRKSESLNVKGAYLEVWADMIGSIGVLVGALAIRITGWTWVDPVVAIAIGLWVLPRTWVLLRDTTNILLEGAPRSAVVADIRGALLATPGVSGVHDLHIWISGADVPTCSVHVSVAPGSDAETVRDQVRARLAADFGLSHLTVQTEVKPPPDKTASHR